MAGCGWKQPNLSKYMKERWADPEYRAAMMEKRKAQGERQKGNTYKVGIPWGMNRMEADNMWIDCRLAAKETILDLKMAGQLDELDPRGEEALETALTVMRSKVPVKDQLAAASLVLKYTKSAPVARQHVTVDAAESWLAAITQESNGEDTDEAGDASDA